MSIFFFSGIQKRATAQALATEKAAGMISHAEYSPNLMKACQGIDILAMDSGAYTKVLTTHDIRMYASTIVEHGSRCIWYANADKIGDQEQSNRNYDYLLSLLPAALHDRVLWIYQYGAPLHYLHAGLERHKRVGIGGLVPLFAANKERAHYLLCNLAAIIAPYQREIHYFGVSSVESIKALHRYHTVYSVDSTTWLVGCKYGALINAQGQHRGGYDFTPDEMVRQNIRTMRKWIETPGAPVEISPYVQLSFDAIV
jgi:hypothetical protein